MYQAYRREFPEPDEIVMVKIDKIENTGVYVQLVEYNGVTAWVAENQISRRRIISISSLIKIGSVEPMVIIAIDDNKRYIDCSKSRLNTEEISLCKNRYSENKFVYNLWFSVNQKCSISQKDFYEKFIYVISEKFKYNNPNDVTDVDYYHVQLALKTELEKPNLIEYFPKSNMEVIREIFLLKSKRPKSTYRFLVEITCFGRDGIDAIKSCILSVEKNSDIKVYLISSPVYVLVYQSDLGSKLVIEKIRSGLELLHLESKKFEHCKVVELSDINTFVKKNETFDIEEYAKNLEAVDINEEFEFTED